MGHPGKERALDGGAGIGRITKGFLMNNFSCVDLVEQDEGFINEAKRQLATANHRGQFFHCGNTSIIGTSFFILILSALQVCKVLALKKVSMMSFGYSGFWAT